MKKLLRTSLSKIINLPLNAIGLALVGKGSSVKPTCSERIRHAKELGFSPRVIIDGGGFKGLWSQEIARIFPGTKIIIIEPNPFVQEDIKKNISHIQPHPIIYSVALGESLGKAKLNIWRDEKSDPGASLLDHVSGKAQKAIEVDVDTLDNISQQTSLTPDLVKLDLQGEELSALKGAVQVLKNAEFMIIEFGCLEAYEGRTTPQDLLDIMYENDYCLYDIVDCHYRPHDGALTGGDFFFVKNSSVLRSYKGWE